MNKFKYGVDGGECGEELGALSLGRGRAARSRKEETRRRQAQGELAHHKIWRVAMGMPDDAWADNPKLMELAKQALANIDPAAREALLCESMDAAISGDKAAIAMWIKKQGLPEAPWEGMRSKKRGEYKVEAIGSHGLTRRFQAASWCAMAAARGSWKVLEAFEADGQAAKERSGVFLGLAKQMGDKDAARQAMMEGHPWVVGMCALLDREGEDWSEGRKALVEAWRPADKVDARVAWEAFAARCLQCQVSAGMELLADMAAPMGPLRKEWVDWTVNALLDAGHAGLAGEEGRWASALCRWAKASPKGPDLAQAEAEIIDMLARAVDCSEVGEIADAARALRAAQAIRSMPEVGWGPLPAADYALRMAELAGMASSLRPALASRSSVARQEIDELAKAWEAGAGGAALRKAGPKRM